MLGVEGNNTHLWIGMRSVDEVSVFTWCKIFDVVCRRQVLLYAQRSKRVLAAADEQRHLAQTQQLKIGH